MADNLGFAWRRAVVREEGIEYPSWKITITDVVKFVESFPQFSRSRLQSGANVALDAIGRRAAGRLSPEALQARMLSALRGERVTAPPAQFVYRGVVYATEEEFLDAISKA
jgi:hypothetical protein